MRTDSPYYEVTNRYGDVVARGPVPFEEIDIWNDYGLTRVGVISEESLPPLRQGDMVHWHNLE